MDWRSAGYLSRMTGPWTSPPPSRGPRCRGIVATLAALAVVAAPLRDGLATPPAVAPLPAAPSDAPPGPEHAFEDDDEDDPAGIALVATGGLFLVGGSALGALAAVVESQDDPPYEPTNATPWWIGAGASAVVGASMLALGVVLLVDEDGDDAVTARVGPAHADVLVRF